MPGGGPLEGPKHVALLVKKINGVMFGGNAYSNI
jgi:hypothetical protein